METPAKSHLDLGLGRQYPERRFSLFTKSTEAHGMAALQILPL